MIGYAAATSGSMLRYRPMSPKDVLGAHIVIAIFRPWEATRRPAYGAQGYPFTTITQHQEQSEKFWVDLMKQQVRQTLSHSHYT